MKFFILLFFCISALNFNKAQPQICHPQCSWKCDDPKCPAICSPVCEPPKCHSSCQEPQNAVCDVKCEKPDCHIMCPDKSCEADDCPKCVNVCKQPHCVTHCQAPKPICEAVCEEPKCDWKCQKPQCPKPKCELVCENPGCKPKIECCKCNEDDIFNPLNNMMFKETEKDPSCCKCNQKNSIPLNIPKTQVEFKLNHQLKDEFQENPQAYDSEKNKENYASQEKLHYSVNPLLHPVRIGPSYYKKPKEVIKRIEAPK